MRDQENQSSMEEKMSDEAEIYKAEESTPETEKVEPEKELCKGDDDDHRLTQLVDEESLDLHDEAVRETLAKDQVEGVRQNSTVESNCVDVVEVKEGDSGKEDVESAIARVDEVPVEVETSPGLSTASMMEPSLSLNPSAASTGQDLSLVSIPTKRSDSWVANNLSVSPALRLPARDGYNWRKYGQKQVKSPRGSRSYYRCTYTDCRAKKIECSNDLGNMIEIVNKGLHSHEPPGKNRFSPRATRPVSVTPPVSEGNTVGEELAIVPSGSDLSASTKENISQTPKISERKRQFENDAVEEPEPKQRLKRDNSPSSGSVSKPGKKHKFVVHAAGDVGISGDGYRWRKYGQKMVKGNPYPRNYYRCTSAGCPVRKHIETAVENTTAVVITYKGVHNHDTPVPKKRHGPPSSMLVAAAAPTSMRKGSKSDDQVNLPASSQCLVRQETEKQSSEALDVGSEKVMESARTLLSIGFEIKQC